MFDIGAAELLLIVIVAIIVIGPSEMPRALRTAGQWIGKVRRVSNHFRAGIDAMVREAEIEDMEKQWKEKNAKIMAEHPNEMVPADPSGADPSSAEARGDMPDADDPYPPEPAPTSKTVEGDPDTLANAARERARPAKTKADSKSAPPEEPPLPFANKGEG